MEFIITSLNSHCISFIQKTYSLNSKVSTAIAFPLAILPFQMGLGLPSPGSQAPVLPGRSG